MELLLKEKDGIHKVQIKGFIEIGDVDSFEIYLRALKSRGIRKIVIEMAEVETIVSGAIGALMGMVDEMEAADGCLVLLNPNTKVLSVFQRMGLDKVFKICYSDDQVKEAMRD